MSEELSESYVSSVDRLGLRSLAAARPGEAPIGGDQRVDAELHYATRFATSAGRSLCAALDPFNKLGDTSNRIIGGLLSEELVLVDVPCGSGAAGIAALDAVRLMRMRRILPTLPLKTLVVAGDISDTSRAYCRDLYAGLAGDFTEAIMATTLRDYPLDVQDARSTSEFINRVVEACSPGAQVVVLAANFSGAMKPDGPLREAYRHFLTQLLGRLAPWNSTLCIIEPESNDAIKFWKWLLQFIKEMLRWFKLDTETFLRCSYEMFDPIGKAAFKSGLTVVSGFSKKK